MPLCLIKSVLGRGFLENLMWPRSQTLGTAKVYCRSVTPLESSQAGHLVVARVLMPSHYTT